MLAEAHMDTRQLGLVRALVYVVQFDRDPAAASHRAVETVIRPGAMDATADDYLAAIRAALAGDMDLSEILPQDHDDATLRAYLRAVEAELGGGARC